MPYNPFTSSLYKPGAIEPFNIDNKTAYVTPLIDKNNETPLPVILFIALLIIIIFFTMVIVCYCTIQYYHKQYCYLKDLTVNTKPRDREEELKERREKEKEKIKQEKEAKEKEAKENILGHGHGHQHKQNPSNTTGAIRPESSSSSAFEKTLSKSGTGLPNRTNLNKSASFRPGVNTWINRLQKIVKTAETTNHVSRRPSQTCLTRRGSLLNPESGQPNLKRITEVSKEAPQQQESGQGGCCNNDNEVEHEAYPTFRNSNKKEKENGGGGSDGGDEDFGNNEELDDYDNIA